MVSIDDFPKIDAHIHFNADRKTVPKLADKYGFDLLTINTEVPEFPPIDKQQQLAVKYRETENCKLYHAATIDTENILEPGWAGRAIKQIKEAMNNGACGIKFWKNIGMSIQRPDGSFLMLDDPELKPVFEFLEQQQIPVLGHQGEPKNCWLPVEEMTVQSDKDYFSAHPRYHMYKHDEYPDYWRHIEARDAVLARHPQLQFVGLHIASLEWSLDEVEQRLDRFHNMAIDLAERISHLYYHAAENRDRVIRFFEKYQDRIIYGTDIIDDPAADPADIIEELTHRWESHWQFLATNKKLSSPQVTAPFQGLALPQSILEKIYRTNAIHWYQLSQK
ncbi:amidohydrolase family protein [Aliifodinibius halophilus]|uniref:Amidohydrolase family protein n=2 Tax=Fodinibius halophilus TaxID=1736908 RepID=A0A6M1T518_9BACT|nr:amidohydrolase family protein [Fodinibius halophilus]